MCFCASASFGAGIVLSVIGVATIKKTHHPSQLLFASIPLIFAVQQIAEGILWLTLPNPDNYILQKVTTYIFLFFAEILWPIWVPIAILLLEKKSTRKNAQKVLVGAGLLVGFYLAFCLISFNAEAKIIGHHISYQRDYPPSLKYYGFALYGLATIASSFFSHIKWMKIFGVVMLISYIVSAIFYTQYILSVWCFFASIISISIYAIIVKISNSHYKKTFKKD